MKDIELSEAFNRIANLKKGANSRILLLSNLCIAVRPIIEAAGTIDGCIEYSLPLTYVTENTNTLLVQVPLWDDTFFNALEFADKNQLNVVCVGWRGDVKEESFYSTDKFDVYTCVIEEALTVKALIESLKQCNPRSIVVYNKLGMIGVLFARTSTNGGVYDFSAEMNLGEFPANTVGDLITKLETLPHSAIVETKIGWPVEVKNCDNIVIISCRDKVLTPRNL